MPDCTGGSQAGLVIDEVVAEIRVELGEIMVFDEMSSLGGQVESDGIVGLSAGDQQLRCLEDDCNSMNSATGVSLAWLARRADSRPYDALLESLGF